MARLENRILRLLPPPNKNHRQRVYWVGSKVLLLLLVDPLVRDLGLLNDLEELHLGVGVLGDLVGLELVVVGVEVRRVLF
jgi:hypothetical protein